MDGHFSSQAVISAGTYTYTITELEEHSEGLVGIMAVDSSGVESSLSLIRTTTLHAGTALI